VTPEAAARALEVEVGGDGSDLSPTERRFCELLITGPYPENATRTYQLLHPDANDGTAGSAGPLLKNEPRIEKYLIRLRKRAIEGSEQHLVEELKNWVVVAVKAKRRIEAHIEGTARMTGTDLAVCREALDRALGRSKETLELDSGDRISKLIMELAGKGPSRYVRPDPRDLLPAGATPDNGGLR